MSVKVLPYRRGSRGALELARALGGRVLRLEGSRYVPRNRDLVINWGNTNPPMFNGVVTLNGRGIRDATNKSEFFRRLANSGQAEIIPPFWTRMEDIPDTAFPVCCRTVLAGHSGEGLVIADTRDDLVPAPLYVKYIKKQDEYRVHVGKRYTGALGRYAQPTVHQSIIIDIQQKRRRQDHDNPNWQIRNHANGFIYAREGVRPPECVTGVAIAALDCLDLDFGAVDVIYNAREDRAYVLEVNTAPGITGTTVERYRDFFLERN